MNHGHEQNDIPASVAVVALLGLAGAWRYFRAPVAMSRAFTELDAYSEAHLVALAVLLFATTINSVWVYSVLSRSFGISRQGQRLQILAKENLKKQNEVRFAWASLALACLLSPAVYLLTRFLAFASFPSFVPRIFFGPIWLVLSVDLTLSLFVCLAAMERGGWFGKLRGAGSTKLPEMPGPQNAIVLGTIEEGTVHA